MGRKRALLVGINYNDDPEHKLRGCWNDVERMGECLVSRYDFPKETICTLVDRPGTSPRLMPTGEVIRDKLGELTRDLQWGDCIVFHFSGHGVQLPPEGEPDETGMKEAIVPVDMNLITDDDFRILVDKIPDGVVFTFIADCCHSGGLIAHSEQQVGSVHTKPISLFSSLGPQPQEEEESEEEEVEPAVVSEEVMIEILAGMLGSVSLQDPSVSLLEILAMMEAANSANQELSLLDLLALYVASQQHNVSMSDILESMLPGQESAPETQNAAQKVLSTSTGSLKRDKQLKKDRIQQMLGSTKAHNIQRLLRSSHARRSLSTRGFGGSPYDASYGGHQHYPPQDQNRSSFSQNILPHQRYAYLPPGIAGDSYNDANASWQYPPPLKYTVSDPGAYAYTHSHAGAPYPSEPNPFGAHPSMQRWGSDLGGGGGGGYGIAGHDRHSGQTMQGGLAQFEPPWAAKPAVNTVPGFGHNHEVGFKGDVYGRQEPVQPGTWSYGVPILCQASGGNKHTKKRSMPVHAVTRKLSERAGHRVEAGNIRANLYDLFGDKSSITCKAVVATILDGLTNEGGSSSARGILKRISSKSIDFLSSKLHDPKMRIDKYLRATTSAAGVTPTTLHHIPKRPDRCVLITACQSDELANEHMELIHGAFTKVILDIVEEHKASPLDNHRLVYESRHRLAKKPYKQHPCLYSTPQQAHNVFICY